MTKTADENPTALEQALRNELERRGLPSNGGWREMAKRLLDVEETRLGGDEEGPGTAAGAVPEAQPNAAARTDLGGRRGGGGGGGYGGPPMHGGGWHPNAVAAAAAAGQCPHGEQLCSELTTRNTEKKQGAKKKSTATSSSSAKKKAPKKSPSTASGRGRSGRGRITASPHPHRPSTDNAEEDAFAELETVKENSREKARARDARRQAAYQSNDAVHQRVDAANLRIDSLEQYREEKATATAEGEDWKVVFAALANLNKAKEESAKRAAERVD
jgi:hypothetical protein